MIARVGVVGGGAMGSGIAQVVATAGIPVVIKEISAELADRGVGLARAVFDRRAAKGAMTAADAETGKALVSGTATYDALADADLVIEAVVERLELKLAVFSELDAVVGPHALLASNTSALPITAMGRATKRPHGVGGLHFFNPAPVMNLVEVVRGADTSGETADALLAFCRHLGKTPVLVNRDTAGFLVNRLLLAYFNEAVLMLQENGADSARTIDGLAAGGGFPMGPLALGDLVGVEVVSYVIETLHGAFGDRFPVPALLTRMAAEGRWGQKRGAGFYIHAEGADPEWLHRTIRDIQAAEGLSATPINFDRLIVVMINEAARMLDEGLVGAADIDPAMQLGTGMKEGPLAIADRLGTDHLVHILEGFRHLGPRFEPSEYLRRMPGLSR